MTGESPEATEARVGTAEIEATDGEYVVRMPPLSVARVDAGQ